MTSDGARSFGYDSENRMTGVGAPGGALAPIPYDPLGRLVGDGNTSFLTDPAGGDAIIGEYWSTGFIRYVPGAGVGEPIAYVRSNGLRRDFYADERGSVIAVDEGGGAVHRQVYDEYGRTANQSYYRFGYTGQARLTRDLHYYKARIYWGAGGRFLQTDPIGYGDGMNLYAYVGGDPVNRTDPSGMCTLWSSTSYNEYKTLSTGGMIFTKEVQGPAFYTVTDCEGGATGGVGGGSSFGVDEGGGVGSEAEASPIVVTGTRVSPRSLSVFFGALLSVNPRLDRCFAYASGPLRAPIPYYVDFGRLQAVATAKFLQHSWPLGANGRQQSTWGGNITSGEALAERAGGLIATLGYLPASGGSVRITGSIGEIVGRDARSNMDQTTFMTIILSPPIPRLNNLPERVPISIYPGCP